MVHLLVFSHSSMVVIPTPPRSLIIDITCFNTDITRNIRLSNDFWRSYNSSGGTWWHSPQNTLQHLQPKLTKLRSQTNSVAHRVEVVVKGFIPGCQSNTVDGRNPAPHNMHETLQIMEYLPYQLVIKPDFWTINNSILMNNWCESSVLTSHLRTQHPFFLDFSIFRPRCRCMTLLFSRESVDISHQTGKGKSSTRVRCRRGYGSYIVPRRVHVCIYIYIFVEPYNIN